MTFHNFVASDMDNFMPGEQNNYFETHLPESVQSHGQQNFIDPRLGQNQCRPPQMERYLMESNKPLFNPLQTQAARDMAFYPSRPEFIAHLPPGSVGRHGSPFSQQYSPASSGAHSPPTESDMCHDGTQGPSTPPDMALLSPYMTQTPYDYLENHTMHQFPLTGLMPNDGCVNLSDINPVNNLPLDAHDNTETHMDYNVDASYVLESSSSSNYEPVMFMPPVMPQQANSETVQRVKEEPCVHNTPSSHLLSDYPAVDEMDEDLKAEGEVVGMPRSPCEDDSDYKPSSRSGPRDTTANPRRSGRPSMATPAKRSKQFKQTALSNPRTKPKLISATASTLKLCAHCSLSFKDENALQKHTRTQHTRPFTCVFHYAGCVSTFATKNEWKRHVVSQHLALTYWLCTADSCAKTTGPSTQQRSASLPTHGAIFNRKDLYTQHVRRMHAPPNARKAIKNKKPTVDWDDRLRVMQDEAKKDRCSLPSYMRCPATDCNMEFRGPNAWDDRMEHVARHLEHAATGDEPPVYFGGCSDPTLRDWAGMTGIDVVRRTVSGWELSNPLRGEGGGRRVSTQMICEEEEDAEGEDC